MVADEKGVYVGMRLDHHRASAANSSEKMRAVSCANKRVKANSCLLTVIVGFICRHTQGFLRNSIAYWRSEKLKFGRLNL
jgi:hypothetical protein